MAAFDLIITEKNKKENAEIQIGQSEHSDSKCIHNYTFAKYESIRV